MSDVEVFGDPDLWICIGKAWSKKENWMKSTKVMQIKLGGCLVLVTNQQGDNISETMTYIPDSTLETDENGMKYIEQD